MDEHVKRFVGRPLADVPTPALILDLDRLEENLRILPSLTGAAGLAHRPHGKGHKSVEIARKQIANGAIGICAQKLGEAEVFAAGGVSDILVTNEIIDPATLERASRLAMECHLTLAVDTLEGLQRLEAAARKAGITFNIVIEIDVGQNRCGVSSVADSITLARTAEKSPHVRLRGLQAYQGKLQFVPGWEERREATAAAMETLAGHLHAFKSGGFCTDIVSGGGTGTLEADCELQILTEVQPGSYAVMDAQYRSIGGRAGGEFDLFKNALFVDARVISVQGERRVTDAGLKALSCDAGQPMVIGFDGQPYVLAGDEHGIITMADTNSPPRLGERLTIVPGHCDTTINLYDRYVVVRNEEVVDIWPVDARGRLN